MSASYPTLPDLSILLALFYDDSSQLGEFELVTADDLPPAFRRLLAHDAHMTVTMEEFHGSRVDVQVLMTRLAGGRYARKILLSKQTDGRVVMFGIPRLNLDVLADDVRREIESQQKPLGRILIEHNVLREVELVALWRVQVGPDLARMFSVPEGGVTYGRTALIHLNGEPAVELLEIAAPV